jgi:hypothetical protein
MKIAKSAHCPSAARTHGMLNEEREPGQTVERRVELTFTITSVIITKSA